MKKVTLIALIVLVLTSSVMATEPSRNGWLDCCRQTNNNVSIRFNVVGDAGQDKGFIQIGYMGEEVKNITVNDDIFKSSRVCCDYVFDKNQCLKCEDEFEKEIGYHKNNKTKIYFIALAAILFFVVIIWLIVKKLKRKNT